MELFRKMEISDIDDILEIEHLSFAVPWTRESFQNEITINPFANYIVLEKDEKIVGYCGVWVAHEHANITNIAILPDYRGQKLGEKLLRYIVNMAKEQHADTISLEVRQSNIVAKNLYTKLGFKPGGVRKNYYTDNGEDALVMWVEL